MQEGNCLLQLWGGRSYQYQVYQAEKGGGEGVRVKRRGSGAAE